MIQQKMQSTVSNCLRPIKYATAIFVVEKAIFAGETKDINLNFCARKLQLTYRSEELYENLLQLFNYLLKLHYFFFLELMRP